MNIEAYKPLIAKVLAKSSGKGMTPDQVAVAICERIASFEEDMALMGGKAALILSSPPPAPGPPPEIDTLSRIGPPEQSGELMERWTKDQLIEFSKNEMPSSIMVKPPDYDQPIELIKYVEAAPGDLGFVSITYQPVTGGQVIDNQRIGPTERISTTDAVLDADALTDSIRKQGAMLYTKQKRVLTPRMPMMTPGEALVGSVPGEREMEARELAGSPGMTMPTVPTFSQQFKQQRG